MAYNRRRQTYKKHWKELVSMYGSMCFWCREEPATCIDHCIPYSWDQNNDIDNLGTAVVLAAGETVRRPTRRKRPVVRRPWMGVELSAAMDAAGMSDATVRWLVTRHIYEQELAGKAGMEGGV